MFKVKKKSIIVIGIGRFGRGVIEGLFERGHDILAIDRDEAALDDVRDMIVSGTILDVEDDEELSRIIGKNNFEEAVVAMGNDFEGTLIATHVLKEAGISVSVKAASERRGIVLKKMGADRVVFPERDMGRRLAHLISNDAIIDLLELPQGFVVEQMEVGVRFTERTFVEMNIPKRFAVYVLLIYRDNQSILPQANTRLKKGDEIIIFGQRDKLELFELENLRDDK
ncbi:TrkA-N domain protein [Desulfofarcimen acetoxidans DSM 771]|uniref:TrkA-N domain protein n=1 Tax=Desulfofarcimen acetoxidans (strain ATCC 49208 / DSM 771 / KCTC 5769 / VKM B-1644 / 5575) TaxID=485916 RepID=C8W5Y4_DESAS|nr:TrkA family potassium uptake protein [Desulfofarcimen acetoxidans]ACV61439.1 TrkA-N domain protein [Desulfofarcimen acetoxidans DSM 771]